MQKYVIGVDFGTESGRALLVNVETGKEICSHLTAYEDGVIDEYLPGSSVRLPTDFALQNPKDYLTVLYTAVPAVLQSSGITPEQVIGLGIDFTACTMLPVDKTLRPLSWNPKWKDHPHSWLKLWKHHAAQDEANRLNHVASKRKEKWLVRYGNKISSEWMIPKIWQILDEAPEVFAATDLFVEATDWVVAQMTGQLTRNSCTAGYKAIWNKKEGYPSEDFLAALDSRLTDLTTTKLRGEIVSIGEKAGGLSVEMAEKMGLLPGTAIAVANVDAHAAVPAVGVVTPGKMVMVMGTSICHMVLDTEERPVEGMCGVVEDGIIPGLYGYEAGQSAVGDIFGWYVENGVPGFIEREAKAAGLNVHQYLEQQAAQLSPGESGLIALDWHNGNRSTLVDTDLTGVLVGMTLLTKPAEIYRAFIEATAYGTRTIIESFRSSGIAVDELYACGGLPQRNRLLLQIYADVTNLSIRVAESTHTPAVGAAIFGAVAAGKSLGGYDSVMEATEKMARLKDEVVTPNPDNVQLYDRLFQEYKELHDYFGRGGNNVMKRMKQFRKAIL